MTGQQGSEYVLFDDFGGGDTITGTLTTRAKRAASIQFMKPWAAALPNPDGALSQADRQHTVWLYILLATVIAAGQPYILRLRGIPTMSKRDRPGGWN